MPGPVTVTAPEEESMARALMVRVAAVPAFSVAPGVAVKRTLLAVESAKRLNPDASKTYSASTPDVVERGRSRPALCRTKEFPTSAAVGAAVVACPIMKGKILPVVVPSAPAPPTGAFAPEGVRVVTMRPPVAAMATNP